MKDIYTIELNLDDDFASSCSYHVDSLMSTIKRNIEHAELSIETNRWVLVGLAPTMDEALDKCEKLQLLLCKRNGRKPITLEDLIYNLAEKE